MFCLNNFFVNARGKKLKTMTQRGAYMQFLVKTGKLTKYIYLDIDTDNDFFNAIWWKKWSRQNNQKRGWNVEMFRKEFW